MLRADGLTEEEEERTHHSQTKTELSGENDENRQGRSRYPTHRAREGSQQGTQKMMESWQPNAENRPGGWMERYG